MANDEIQILLQMVCRTNVGRNLKLGFTYWDSQLAQVLQVLD